MASARIYPALSSLISYWGYPIVSQVVLARNVANTPEIEAYTTGLHQFAGGDPKIEAWLDSNLRKYLIRDFEEVRPLKGYEGEVPAWMKKAMDAGENVYQVSIPQWFKNKIQHAIDYLKSDDAPERMDKLSVPDAITQSDEWGKKLTKQKVDLGLALEGENILKTYPDGYTWRELTSEAALTLEGNLMGHCVGSYWRQVESGRVAIWSLRDGKNQPHATLELDPGQERVDQIKGKQNSAVVEKYHSYIKDILSDKLEGWDVQAGELANTGLFNIDGQMLDLADIKANPELLEVLLERVIPKKLIGEATIELNDDGVVVGGLYTHDFLNLLSVSLHSKIIKDLGEILENHYDTDWYMKDEDPSRLIDPLEKTHPKTYKKIMKAIEKAELADESTYANDEGPWLASHAEEVSEIYEAANGAISDGWSVGTSDAAYKYVTNLLSDIKIEDGSYTYQSDNKMLWLVVSFAALAEQRIGESESDIDDLRGFDHDYDEKAAQERFYDLLQESKYTID